METDAGGTRVHYGEHGDGRPVLVLHGAGVDHREAVAGFDPALEAHGGLWRIYPDLPGAGLTRTAETVQSAEDVLDVLFALIDEVVGERGLVLVGHSAGAWYAQALADRAPERIDGLVLVCPLLAGTHDVPPHRPVVADENLGDPGFREYFVVQTPEMLERYQQSVAPGVAAADSATAERIGQHWELEPTGAVYDGPVLVVAGRQDSTVGYAASVDLLGTYAHVTLAVVDGAGHALPHEKPAALSGILTGWLSETAESSRRDGV